jgi:hypothetical protein
MATNLAYFLSNKHMSGAQRMPLYDLGFDLFPVVTGFWWDFTDYLIYALLFYGLLWIAGTFFVMLHMPNREPLYPTILLKRACLALIVLQTLRIISFLCTLLPGSSVQCLYTPSEAQLADKASLLAFGVASGEGNPEGWNPPSTAEVFTRIDPSSGCGDLMFSSHTLFAMLITCMIWTYFGAWWNKLMTLVAIAILVPLTLASRKHYSIDVFTALYVVPMWFELQKSKVPDARTSKELLDKYGIEFSHIGVDAEWGAMSRTVDGANVDADRWIVKVDGATYYANEHQVPLDLKDKHGKVKIELMELDDINRMHP